MKNTLISTANKFQIAQRRAYIRRVMWLSFQERLDAAFTELKEQKNACDALGNLYLSFSKDSYPEYADNRYIYVDNALNQAQISAGWRHVNVWHTFGKAENTSHQSVAKKAIESGAAISFSQDISGRVAVVLFPYKSDLSKVDEDNIILMYGIEPNDLTAKEIRKILRTFLRYCAATSMVTLEDYGSSIFRIKLRMLDIRNRRTQKTAALKLLEKSVVIVLAAGSVFATFYTSSKWIW